LLGLGAIAGTLALSALMSSKDKEKEKEKEPKNYYS
jgi:hypothetical protein